MRRFFIWSHLTKTKPFFIFAHFAGYIFGKKHIRNFLLADEAAPSVLTLLPVWFARSLASSISSIRQKLASRGTIFILKFQVSELRLNSMCSDCLRPEREQCSQYGHGILRFHKSHDLYSLYMIQQLRWKTILTLLVLHAWYIRQTAETKNTQAMAVLPLIFGHDLEEVSQSLTHSVRSLGTVNKELFDLVREMTCRPQIWFGIIDDPNNSRISVSVNFAVNVPTLTIN